MNKRKSVFAKLLSVCLVFVMMFTSIVMVNAAENTSSKETYMITFIADGEVWQTKPVTAGNTMVMPDPVNAPGGLVFDYWKNNDTGDKHTAGSLYRPTGDATFVAQYTFKSNVFTIDALMNMLMQWFINAIAIVLNNFIK